MSSFHFLLFLVHDWLSLGLSSVFPLVENCGLSDSVFPLSPVSVFSVSCLSVVVISVISLTKEPTQLWSSWDLWSIVAAVAADTFDVKVSVELLSSPKIPSASTGISSVSCNARLNSM